MTSDAIGDRLAELAKRLANSKVRFATAESCTGGQLAAAFARHAALGSHLERGFVVYSVDAKREMLGISRELATRSEGVSAEVTDALANAALAESRADIAVAVTGFCGPREGDEEVGLVYLACAARGHTLDRQCCHFGDIGRTAVLDAAVAAALAMMAEALCLLGDGGSSDAPDKG